MKYLILFITLILMSCDSASTETAFKLKYAKKLETIKYVRLSGSLDSLRILESALSDEHSALMPIEGNGNLKEIEKWNTRSLALHDSIMKKSLELKLSSSKIKNYEQLIDIYNGR